MDKPAKTQLEATEWVLPISLNKSVQAPAKDVLQRLVGHITPRVHGDLDRYGCGDYAC